MLDRGLLRETDQQKGSNSNDLSDRYIAPPWYEGNMSISLDLQASLFGPHHTQQSTHLFYFQPRHSKVSNPQYCTGRHRSLESWGARFPGIIPFYYFPVSGGPQFSLHGRWKEGTRTLNIKLLENWERRRVRFAQNRARHIREVQWVLTMIVYLGVVLINLLNVFSCQNVGLCVHRINISLLYLERLLPEMTFPLHGFYV